MFYALVNGKNTVQAKSFSALKRKATIAANNTYNAIDTFVMWNDIDGVMVSPEKGMTFTRVNQKAPNNTIRRGRWR